MMKSAVRRSTAKPSATNKRAASSKTEKGSSNSESNARLRECVVVGIGASAGGLEAYKQLLRNMPADSGLAFVFVQHLDPSHESMMVELLSRHTSMPVSQIANATPIRPNHVYMIHRTALSR